MRMRRIMTVLGCAAVLAGCGAPGRRGASGVAARSFASPEAAVPQIDAMLRKEDWKSLASYYDLAGSGVDRKDLETGKFFIRSDRPAVVHPGLPWKYRHPFPPGYRFVTAAPTEESSVVEVTVAIEIDEGGGLKQRGLALFRMRKGGSGYRVLPPVSDKPVGAAAPRKLTWTGYDGTGDPATAAYALDGKALGTGDAGLKALQEAIRDMKRGTVLEVVPYYGDPGGDQARKYPFDLREMRAYAEGCGVMLGVPGAK